MSMSSDVFITREQAENGVRAKLLAEYECMLDIALKAMDDSALCSYLHTDYTFYNIGGEE